MDGDHYQYESEDVPLLSKRQRKKLASGSQIEYYEKTEYVSFEKMLCFLLKYSVIDIFLERKIPQHRSAYDEDSSADLRQCHRFIHNDGLPLQEYFRTSIEPNYR